MNTNHWRDASRGIKVFGLSGGAVIFAPLLILNFLSIATHLLVWSSVVFFAYLNYIGYTFPNFIRLLHKYIVGEKANGKPKWFQKKYF